MVNKFKLWVSRNSSMIFLVIMGIIAFYLIINGASNNSQNEQQEENEVTVSEKDEIEIGTNSISDNDEFNLDIDDLQNETEEYEQVKSIIEKFLEATYEANIETDNEELKQNVYNMLSDEYIQKCNRDIEEAKADEDVSYVEISELNSSTVLNFVISVDEYEISKIYIINQKNNITRYLVVLQSEESEDNLIDYEIYINVDYYNNTFSYDGGAEMDEIEEDIEITSIQNKESNTF